ncbi:MAG: type II secretion system protein GspL, partial [Kiritimatiellae bacterium]|nr:type II secretion system protein GspL [Kiritimatiellia bacterium]
AAAGERPVFTAPVCIADSVFRWLSTPFPSLRKARRVFPALLNTQLPFDLAQCQYALLSLHAKEGEARALAVAVRHETLRRILEQCASLGLDPQIVQHEGIALWQEALAAQPSAPSESRVLVCLGRHRTLLLYGKGPNLYGAQQMPSGADSLCTQQEYDAWAAKARLFLHTHCKETEKPLNWIWCGPGAAQAEPRTALEKALNLPDSITYRQADRLFSDAPVAQALARMIATSSTSLHNFRAGAFAHPQALQQDTKIRRNTLLWVILLGLFLCLTGLLWQAMVFRQNKVLDRQIEEAVGEITEGARAPKAQEVPFVSRILEERRNTLSTFSDMTARPAEALLTKILGMASEYRITIQQLALHPDTMELKGFADRWDAGTHLEKLLKSSGYQTDLQRREAGADEMVHFTLKGIHRENK